MGDDDSTEVTVTRGTLRRWADQLDNADDRIGHARIVASAIRSVLETTAVKHPTRTTMTHSSLVPASEIDNQIAALKAELGIDAPGSRTAEETDT